MTRHVVSPGALVHLVVLRPSNDLAILRGRLVEVGLRSGENAKPPVVLNEVPRWVRLEDPDLVKDGMRKRTPEGNAPVILIHHSSEDRPEYEPVFEYFRAEPDPQLDVVSVADLVDERNRLRRKKGSNG